MIAFGPRTAATRRGGAGAGARARLPDRRVRRRGRRVGVPGARPPTRSCARSWSRRSTTCCGSSCTCSSSTAGCCSGAPSGAVHDTGASSFLYPFLAEGEADLDAVLADVRGARCVMKAEEIGALREQTLGENREALLGAAAAACARAFEAGGRLLALGNGGSATDAMDAVADFRAPPAPRWPAAPGARPDRGPGDPHRDRQRHRRRGDLRPPGDRPRPRRATRCWRSRPAATRPT